jgi:hypothetical protein
LLTVPENYSDEDKARDLTQLSRNQIVDLSDGAHRLADVLAAVEWRRTLLPLFTFEGFGDLTMVDVTEIDVDGWSGWPELSVERGLMALASEAPVWIMQKSGQNAHLWPGVRDQPIFSRHVDNQFCWLNRIYLYPTWMIYYLTN